MFFVSFNATLVRRVSRLICFPFGFLKRLFSPGTLTLKIK